MLSELELKIVNECKVWYCGAALQCFYFDYPRFIKQIRDNYSPTREDLEKTGEKVERLKSDFDIVYFINLSEQITNPLRIEQQAWSILSPLIGIHVTQMKGYLEQNRDLPGLLKTLENGWSLMQKWNIISNSYKAKYEQCWNDVVVRERKVIDLIEELSKSAE